MKNMPIYRVILPKEIMEKQKVDTEDFCLMTEINTMQYHESCFLDKNIQINSDEYKKEYGFELSNSEILNFLTHRRAWEMFLKTDSKWCLVIESNVSIEINEPIIEETINELSPDWDVFFPYDRSANYWKNIEKKNGGTIPNFNYWELSKKEPYLLDYKFGNSIYLLSRSGAEKLYEITVIDDRLDHVILKKTEEAPFINLFYSEVDWFTIENIRDYNWPDRTQSLLNFAIQQSSWTENSLCKSRCLLKQISQVGEKFGIDLILEAGTLLGYVRHQKIMPWDDDIDIGVEENKIPLFLSLIEDYDNLRWSGGHIYNESSFFKIWDVRGETIDGYSYTFPFVDIWPYNFIEDSLIYRNGNNYPDVQNVGFEDIYFEGSQFKIPKNYLAVLDSCFVDWREMIRVYSYSHKVEKVLFKYLCIPIETDDKGYMLTISKD